MSEWDESDAQLELRLRTWAIPVALASAFFLVWAVPSLVRIFLSMWVHELGHATTAWMCGYLAFPGPWLTPTASRQSLLFELLVLGALGFGVFRAFRQERPGLARALIAVAALQLFCAALLGPARQRQLIVFMGDGGCLVIGTLLMLSIYTRAAAQGWLRWGFLGIGAAAKRSYEEARPPGASGGLTPASRGSGRRTRSGSACSAGGAPGGAEG